MEVCLRHVPTHRYLVIGYVCLTCVACPTHACLVVGCAWVYCMYGTV